VRIAEVRLINAAYEVCEYDQSIIQQMIEARGSESHKRVEQANKSDEEVCLPNYFQ